MAATVDSSLAPLCTHRSASLMQQVLNNCGAALRLPSEMETDEPTYLAVYLDESYAKEVTEMLDYHLVGGAWSRDPDEDGSLVRITRQDDLAEHLGGKSTKKKANHILDFLAVRADLPGHIAYSVNAVPLLNGIKAPDVAYLLGTVLEAQEGTNVQFVAMGGDGYPAWTPGLNERMPM